MRDHITMRGPSDDREELGQALSDLEWTTNQARAALQEAEGVYTRIPWWRPDMKLRMRRAIRRLRVVTGIGSHRED